MEDRIVKITVAGKVKEYEDGLNITQLIEKENVDGDEVEFLYFMGGGR